MSAALELVRWTKHREDDLRQARNTVKYVRQIQGRRNRAAALDTLHRAVALVRSDNEQIQREVDMLSLCSDHALSADCTCVAPF